VSREEILTLVWRLDLRGRETRTIDVSAVEQILFNLVDNACKYAGPDTTEKRLHLMTESRMKISVSQRSAGTMVNGFRASTAG
jgi:K+-sensing histidine kinase KdpD